MPAAAPYFFINRWSVSAGLHENDPQKRYFVELSMAVRAAGPPSSAAVARESSPSRTSDHRDPLPGAPPAG